ncbi:MAG: 3-5 exoribonuclease [Deferribacteres bacterium]|jgi:3'-5' exoribonuclease|nr:3-5 exoribonuclease [Deferribacteres bacterium]
MELSLNKKYMIFELVKSFTKDDRPYIRVVLLDSQGEQYSGIMFDSNKLEFEPEKGDIVEINGSLQNYNGQLQIKINNMIKGSIDDLYDFLPKSKFDSKSMLNELKRIVYDNIDCDFVKKLMDEFFKDTKTIEQFSRHPAAKNVHHAYVGGLLEHTLSVVRLGVLLSDYYSEYIDKNILIAGAVFHDIGKVFELDIAKGFDYTDSGKLLGHLLLGIDLVKRYIDNIENFPANKANLILHLIASHHGYIEFGAIKKPKTYEALILHHIDDLDAKINNFTMLFEKEKVQSGWSSYDRLLERQIFKHKD